MLQICSASTLRVSLCIFATLWLIGCSSTNLTPSQSRSTAALSNTAAADADDYTLVHCLVAGQIRRIGGMTYVGKRKPRITTIKECRLLGGEYVLDTSDSHAEALNIWQEAANRGDAEAQYYIGEIYEKGLAGQQPDYALAAVWYQKAASLGYKRAAVNLGHLYEQGLGVGRDSKKAEQLYRQAAESNPSNQSLLIPPTEGEPLSTGASFGQYYALVIGNNNYQHWQPLNNAINDARAVAQQLQQRYGFKVTELYNAERATILSAINSLRKQLTENDNLLIYYAGHGHLVEELNEGYWIPVDAKHDDNTEWISTRNITGQLKIMSAKHVLVVADSCYAGTLSRGSLSRLKPGISETKRMQLLASFASSRVRTALTSGGVQPVLDSGGSGHSVFTKAFLEVLRENGLTLETERLFLEIRERVSTNAFDLNVRQIPTYEPIHMAGHEAGDFVFVPL